MPEANATEHDIQSKLIVQVQSYAEHAHRLTYIFVGIILLLLAAAGVGGYYGYQAYAGQVSRAEALEKQYVEAQKDFMAQLAAHNAERTTNAKESAVLVARVAARAAQAPAPVVRRALEPTATALEVRNGLQDVLSDRGALPSLIDVQGENLVVPPATAQIWLSDEVVLTRVKADLTDTNRLLSLANADKSSLTSDLTQCKATLGDAQKSVDAYKKAAKVTRFRKFLNGAEKVGILIVGISLGHTF
jgi:hypothetical protein